MCASEIAQPNLIIELILKNAPGLLVYRDIGALAVVSKAMDPILLETASYRKAFMIKHSSPLSEKRVVWNLYATAAIHVGTPFGAFNNMKAMWSGTAELSFFRRQLISRTVDGRCISYNTIGIAEVLPAATPTASGHVLWHCKAKSKKHGFPRTYLCLQPYFDNYGNAHVEVQQMVGDYVDQGATMHYVLKSDGTSEKRVAQ